MPWFRLVLLAWRARRCGSASSPWSPTWRRWWPTASPDLDAGERAGFRPRGEIRLPSARLEVVDEPDEAGRSGPRRPGCWDGADNLGLERWTARPPERGGACSRRSTGALRTTGGPGAERPPSGQSGCAGPTATWWRSSAWTSRSRSVSSRFWVAGSRTVVAEGELLGYGWRWGSWELLL